MDMNMTQLAQMMSKGRSGIKKAAIESGIAGILADIINAQRLNTKMLAKQHGVDVEANMMTEERAAELLTDAIKQDLDDFAAVFDEILDNQDITLQAAMGDAEYQQYYRQRENALPYIGEPTGDDEGGEDEDEENTDDTDEEHEP